MAKLALRPMRPDDVEGLVELTAKTGFFRSDEVAVAREVLTDCAKGGRASGYSTWVAASGPALLGYICYGPTPLTHGTWDIYWAAVDLAQHRRGIGRALMLRAEEEMLRRGARLVIVETSSQERYTPTRRFYQAMGFREAGRVPDFYDVGDAKVLYAKVLSTGGASSMAP